MMGPTATLATGITADVARFALAKELGADICINVLLVRKEVRFQGVWTHTLENTIQAMRVAESGKYPLEKFISHEFPLDQAEKAVQCIGREISDRSHQGSHQTLNAHGAIRAQAGSPSSLVDPRIGIADHLSPANPLVFHRGGHLGRRTAYRPPRHPFKLCNTYRFTRASYHAACLLGTMRPV